MHLLTHSLSLSPTCFTSLLASVVGDSDFECLSVLQEHTQDVKMVLFNPQREMLASASYDDTIKLWVGDEDDWYCADTLKGHGSTVWAVDFDSTGNRLGK